MVDIARMTDKTDNVKTVQITIKDDEATRGPAPERRKDTKPNDVEVAAGSPFHTGRVDTQIIVYIQETGSEPLGHGNEVEIRGSVTTSGLVVSDNRIEVDLPEHTNFANENNGLGRMVWRRVFRTFQFPPNFHAYIYEEGGAGTTKKILNRAVDFAAQPNNDFQWGFWWWPDSSPQDPNFKAHVAWSVDDVA
jgi:hypothetical protein